MNFFLKNINKIIILFLFSLCTMVTFNTNASNAVNTERCKDVLHNVFVKVNKKVMDSRTEEGGREQHLDSLFSFFEEEYKRGKDGNKSDLLDTDLGICFAVPLENDIAIKLIRMLYGENVNKPLVLYTSLWGKIWNQNLTLDTQKLNEETEFLNFIPNIIISFNNIVFYIAILLISFIYGKSVLSSLYERDPRKLKENGNNIRKIILGLSLIAPISIFGGFSLIQFIFIVLLIFSILLAKILWMFIVLSMNFSYMEKDVEEIIIEEGLVGNYVKPVLDNVMMHICDIKRREEFLSEKQYTFNNDIDRLNKNSYYGCLTSSAGYEMTSSLQSDLAFYPSEVMQGKYCAKKHQKIKENESYCGYIERPNLKSAKTEELRLIKSSAYHALGIEDTSYQNIMRGIAYDAMKINCITNGGDNKLNNKNSSFTCVKTNLSTGKYDFDSKTRLIQFNNKKIKKPAEKSKLMSDFYENNVEKLKEHFTKKIPELASVVALSKFKNDHIKDEVSSFISLYEKGFAMAGTIFYERVNLLLVDKAAVSSFKDVYNVYKPLDYFYLQDQSSNYSQNILKESEYPFMMSAFIKVLDVFPYLLNYSEGVINYSLKEKMKSKGDSLLLNWTDISKGNTQCMEDYQKCNLVAINPFLDLMDTGQQMMYEGVFMQLGVVAISKIFTYMTGSGNGITGLISQLFEFIESLLKIYIFIGFFFSILIPFIPFFIYASLIFAWIVQTLKVILSAQLLSILFIIPSEGQEGKEIQIFKLMLKTALQPLLLLTGFLVCIMMANISITLVNVWLSIIQDTLGLNEPTTTILSFLNNVIGVIMYAFFVVFAIIKSTEAISVIPKSMSSWLGIEIEEDKMFAKLQENIESFILPYLKKPGIF